MVIPSSRRRTSSKKCRVGPRLFFFLGVVGFFLQIHLIWNIDAPKNRILDDERNRQAGQILRSGENSTNQFANALDRVRKGSGLPPRRTQMKEKMAEQQKHEIKARHSNPSNVPVAQVGAKSTNASIAEIPDDAKPKNNLKATVQSNHLLSMMSSANASFTKPHRPLIPLPLIEQKNGFRVGYAISLIKCGDFQSSPAGLIDASLIMRHSIHLTHLQSKYDYKMYAILHRQAVKCSQVLRDVGFEIVLVDQPVNASDIRGEHLRENIHKEWCCGEQEFVKLFAYTLPDPVIVHVDIDFAFYMPMDDLFDAILYDKNSPEGKLARARIPLERPKEGMPDKIGAFITRDWPQVVPGRKPLYQAGFLVARRDPTVLKEVVDVVLEGNFSKGYGRDNGWGDSGYGGLVGAMAMQGLMAYYYDMVRPNTAVELNQCRFNHMGMDVLYRHHPNFRKKHPKVGKCRNDLDYCEDCTITDLDLIHNVHYTQCRKPWNCVGIGHPGGTTPEAKKKGIRANAIDTNAGNFDHCMELVTQWHTLRSDFENKLFDLTNDSLIKEGRSGNHKFEYFQGHCLGEGGKNYMKFNASKESLRRVAELYQ